MSYKSVQRIKTNYGILNYCRLNLNQYPLSGTWYDLNRQQYLLNPTLSGESVARKLPAVSPFKTAKYDISEGMPQLTMLAKRNKWFITNYLSANNTYNLSGNVDFTYLYPRLQTKVYYYNQVKDVTISFVNTATNTFTTSNDVWGKDLSVTAPALSNFYVLDELITVADDTSGSWKLFPYTKLNPVLSADQDVLFKKVINTPYLLPARDTTNSLTSAFTVPFALQFEANTFTDRYYLSTAPGEQRTFQVNPSGRVIYDDQSTFTDYIVATVPLTTTNVLLSSSTTSFLSYPYPGILDVAYKLRINKNFIFTPVPYSLIAAGTITYTRYTSPSGAGLPARYVSGTIYPLTATNTGVRPVTSIVSGPGNSLNPPIGWGQSYDVSDDHIIISCATIYSPLRNELHLYRINETSNAPMYADLQPLSIITPVTSIQGMTQATVSAYGSNLIIDSRYKRKGAVDVIAHSYQATVSGKRTNVIESATISYKTSAYERDFYIFDFNYPHLSANAVSANRITDLALILDSSELPDKYTVIAAQRPGVTYNGKTGIIEIYGKSSNTPIKLYKILTTDDSTLSAASGVKFGGNIIGELGTMCVTVTSNNGSQVEIYDFNTITTITTATALTAASGVKSTYSFDLTPIKRTAVRNFENASDTSFGRNIYYDDAVGYDPFFENETLYTNRLFVQNNSKVYIFEEFQNEFLPLVTVPGAYTNIAAYYNTFCALSSLDYPLVPWGYVLQNQTNIYTLSTSEVIAAPEPQVVVAAAYTNDPYKATFTATAIDETTTNNASAALMPAGISSLTPAINFGTKPYSVYTTAINATHPNFNTWVVCTENNGTRFTYASASVTPGAQASVKTYIRDAKGIGSNFRYQSQAIFPYPGNAYPYNATPTPTPTPTRTPTPTPTPTATPLALPRVNVNFINTGVRTNTNVAATCYNAVTGLSAGAVPYSVYGIGRNLYHPNLSAWIVCTNFGGTYYQWANTTVSASTTAVFTAFCRNANGVGSSFEYRSDKGYPGNFNPYPGGIYP